MSEQERPPTGRRLDPSDPFDAQWIPIAPGVFRMLVARLKSAHDARDATHQVYLKVRQRSTEVRILHLAKYANTVARNVAKEWLRTHSRHTRLSKKFQQLESGRLGNAEERTPERIYEGQQLAKQAQQTLERLPEKDRLMFEASTDGESTQSIAARFDVEPHKVYRLIRRIRQRLRKVLGLARDRKP